MKLMTHHWFSLTNRNRILHSIGKADLKRFENNIDLKIIDCEEKHMPEIWDMIQKRAEINCTENYQGGTGRWFTEAFGA